MIIFITRFLTVISVVAVLACSLQAADQLTDQRVNLKETVVVLHGIAMTSNSMRSVARFLEKEGFKTLSITYPSRSKSLDDIAEYLHSKHLTKKFWKNAKRVHVVTHSMGGLVARRYFDIYKNTVPKNKLGRVVMLAPPNGGSEVSDLIHKLPLYKWYYGPAGNELTTDAQSLIKSDVYYDLGIVAGTKEWPYFVAAFVTPGKSDGRVTVAKTKLKGMKDHITVNATHTFIMKKPNVQQQIVYFLKNGIFEREQSESHSISN